MMTDIPHLSINDPSGMPDGHWIDKDGDEVWVKDGRWHRLDGPAIIYSNGETDWFLNDRSYSFERWLALNDEITEEQRVMLKLEYG